MTRYSIRCYDISKNSNRVTTQSNSGIFPESKPNYYFFNVGNTEVYVEAIYGTAFSWIGAIGGTTLNAGGGSVVSTGGRSYYYTGQKVYNRDSNKRALVHCSTVNGWSSYDSGDDHQLKIDINKVSKMLVQFGVGKIPYVGGALSGLVGFFWPNNEPSVWDQIKDQVNVLVDQKTMDMVKGLLGGELRYMKERVTVLSLELNDPNSNNTNTHYMNIAEDFIGFEKKFSFAPSDHSNYKNVNYFLLPMYSAVVNLKVLFYQFGIINQQKLKLTNDNIHNIKTYLSRVIEEPTDGAIKYINQVYDDQFGIEYETCNPDNVYNALAVVRQYCAINGFEFFEYWKAIIKNPLSEKKPYNTTISYSTLFSRPTPISSRQMVAPKVEQPLNPAIVNGKCNKMTKLIVWIFRMRGGAPKIQGMRIHYENGYTHDMGKSSSETVTIDFKGKYLKKLTAWGYNALDMFEFEFTDGSKQSAGSNSDSRGYYGIFELDYHHIAGMFVGNDVSGLGGQSAGVSVSYQLTPTS